MYNLLVSADEEAWEGQPFSLWRSRALEHTEDAIVSRFKEFTEKQLTHIYSLPSIFAYETGVNKKARMGWIRKAHITEDEVQIEYEFWSHAIPISPEILEENKAELDIGVWELSRTHWAIKDVDIIPFLKSHKLFNIATPIISAPNNSYDNLPPGESIFIRPAVFRIPQLPIDTSLVAMMMPFRPEFDAVLSALTSTCHELGLNIRTAKQMWENSEIIQNIFSLIYRSRFVLCDFTGQNANVFYEAGIAHTLGKTVIPIAQDISDLPFDLRHHRAAVYQNTEQGIANLMNELKPRFKWLMEHE